MRQDEFGLFECQRADVTGIVKNGPRVGRGGGTPTGIGLHERQAQHQGAEKGFVDDEPGPRGYELVFDSVIFMDI
jgi:hypothetical protein